MLHRCRADNLYVVTWGALKSMSWPFYLAYADEAYGVLSADFIAKATGKAPSGFDLAELLGDLKELEKIGSDWAVTRVETDRSRGEYN